MFPGDLNFLENRRKALRRWLTLLSRHPIISQDAILHFFLTQAATDLHTKIKEIFKTVPDEFMTSEYSAKVKVKVYNLLVLNILFRDLREIKKINHEVFLLCFMQC